MGTKWWTTRTHKPVSLYHVFTMHNFCTKYMSLISDLRYLSSKLYIVHKRLLHQCHPRKEVRIFDK